MGLHDLELCDKGSCLILYGAHQSFSWGRGVPSSERLSETIENMLENVPLCINHRGASGSQETTGTERLQHTPDLMQKKLQDNLY